MPVPRRPSSLLVVALPVVLVPGCASRGGHGTAATGWYFVAADEGHGFKHRRTRDPYYTTLVAFVERHLGPR